MSAKILVVDDEPSIVDVLTRFLSREGYSVVTATNGREALERVKEDPPDLILLDVTMPEVDGFTVCQRIKEDERTALIPITMLTGLDDREHRTRGIEAGADDFLTKPFEQSILRARIRSQLRIKRLTDQLEHTEKVIFMLAQAVEAKDAYTEGHLRRLRRYGEQLAQGCGLPPGEVAAVRYGGILHDIGKIGVDEAILRKPGPLTWEEAAQMRRHPEIGAQIISQMRFAREVAPIISAHHEYWDGSGYPRGLRGEDIPIGARIITIVDAYDAMMTDRPYRSALGEAETIRRMREARGTQFDPEVLYVFLDLVASGAIASEREGARVASDGEL
jgi:putative two-component system response regulator